MDVLIAQWWAITLRGVLASAAALAIGVVPMGKPQTLFAWYAALHGVLNLIATCWSNRDLHGAWVLILAGIVGIEVALLTVLWPAITTVALLSIVTTWAVVTGVLDILAGFEARYLLDGEWLFAVSGSASIVSGLLVQQLPDTGSLILLIQICTASGGVAMIALGIKLRQIRALRHYHISGTSVMQAWFRHRRR